MSTDKAEERFLRIHELLEQKARLYNSPAFIEKDPVCIAHRFSKKQDIEIAGFFAATLAWGNRTTIINSSNRIMQLMDNSPYDFVRNHKETDLKSFIHFVHRTFNATDLLYFISVLQAHYMQFATLEDAFVPGDRYLAPDTGDALIRFHEWFFSGEHPERTRKHVATPLRNSACKRLNMYVRVIGVVSIEIHNVFFIYYNT